MAENEDVKYMELKMVNESALSSPCVSFGQWTNNICFSGRYLYPMSHFTGFPLVIIFLLEKN